MQELRAGDKGETVRLHQEHLNAQVHLTVMLESAAAGLVQEDGKPVGVLTRQDLLTVLARG